MNIGNHHAYVIEGDREMALETLRDYLKDFYKFSTYSHPDIFEFHFPNFLVENSREIKETDIKSPFQFETKTIIISFDSVTREAQNALLKVLEDPSPTSRFFIVTNSSEILLPTILSRVEVVRHESYDKIKSQIDVKKFVQDSKAQRLETVGKIIKKISDEELSKEEVGNFLKSLKMYLEEELIEGRGNAEMLKTVLNALIFSRDKSASAKLLLERVSLC